MAKKGGKKGGPRKRYSQVFKDVRRTRAREVDALTRRLSKEEAAQSDYLSELGQGLDLSGAGLADITAGTEREGSMARTGILSRYGLEQEGRGVRQEQGTVDFMNAVRSGRLEGEATRDELAAQIELAQARAAEAAAARAAQNEALRMQREQYNQAQREKEINARLTTQAIRHAEEQGRSTPTAEDFAYAREVLTDRFDFKPREVYPLAALMGAQATEVEQGETEATRQGRLGALGLFGEGADKIEQEDLVAAATGGTPFEALGRQFNRGSDLYEYLSTLYGPGAVAEFESRIGQLTDPLTRRITPTDKYNRFDMRWGPG